jgi:NADH-quinone oxidoreductase subunit M
MLGAYQVMPWYAIIATVGVILAAWYMLTAFRKMAQGQITRPENDKAHLKDLRFDEVLLILPLVFLFFIIGLFPNLFFDKINPSVEALVAQQQARIEQGSITQQGLPLGELSSKLMIAETVGQ